MKPTIAMLALAAFFIFSASSPRAQGCLPEGIVFNNQEEVDNFELNHPGCTTIEGMVQIGGTVSNLAGLNVVEVFEGDVLVFGSELTDFSGLNEQVSILGWLQVYECPTLVNLDGLQAVDSLPGGITVMESPAFTDLSGLENLVFAYSIDLSINASLEDITALGSLESVATDLTFYDNDALVSLQGLESLQYVGHWLYFMHNDNITHLNNLQSLLTVGSNFTVLNNDALTTITGLNSELVLEGNLKIKDNDNLAECAAWAVCEYLQMPAGTITIENNAQGCNSIEQVEEACSGLGGCLPEGITLTTQEEIDAFPLTWPDCIQVEGFMHIATDTLSPFPVVSLAPLGNITAIGGDLMITGNAYLKNLSGLENLAAVGGSLQISYNDSLQGLQALSGLQSLGGGLHFQMNKALLHLQGLEGLSAVNGDLVFMQHPILQNMDGFQNIAHVAGDFSISWLCSMDNLTGFAGLKSIGGSMSVGHLCDVVNLDGFDSLQYISGQLNIYENDTLDDISGIGNIHVNSITGLEIIGNKNLSACHVNSVCGFLLEQVGSINIAENLPGCNSPEEVAEACTTCLPDGILFESQDDLAAFLLEYPDCSKISGDVQIVGEDITDLSALANITEIEGTLYIAQTYLENLQGLNQLVSVQGELTLYQNNYLEHLAGLESLETTGGAFGIGYCPVFNFVGLEVLTTVGDLSLFFTGTQEFTGLETLTSIEGDLSLDELSELQSLEALQSLETINGSLTIFSTALSSLAGLDNIDHNSISDLTITNNENLSSCDVASICNYLADPTALVTIHSNAPGCEDAEEVTEACLTAVAQMTGPGKNVVLAPNPAKGDVSVYSEDGHLLQGVWVSRLSGQLVYEDREPKLIHKVNHLRKGMYLVKIQLGQEVLVKKLLVF